MAHITYDIMWREAMMDLLDQLEAENPEDPSLAPQDFTEWACVYIKYLQIFRKLEHAYDQMVHPQKLVDMKKSLEACMGRLLEVRHWLVKLNRGLDLMNIDDILVDLKLTPYELELPVPKYFRHDRSKELDNREMYLTQLIKSFNPKKIEKSNKLDSGAPLDVDEAVLLLQRSERGRQGREAMRVRRINKRQRQLADRRNREGAVITHETAVIRIQAALRGMLWRRQIQQEADEELTFIGMKPKPVDPDTDPQHKERKNATRRKLQQTQNRSELDRDLPGLKQKVQETEGQDMRETVQDKINAWFVENRDPETGEYPDFPDAEDGGSKIILNPPPPPVEAPAVDEKAAKGGKEAAKGKDAKGKGKGAKDTGEDAAPPQQITSIFVPEIEQAVQDFVAKWQERDESMNFAQKYDPDLVKDELRPVVFEEVRQQVDEEMQVLLENLKDMVEAEKAAKAGKKVKKKKKKKKKAKKAKKGGKKKKDPTADRALESLFVEMVSQGLLVQCPKANIGEYLGSSHFIGATLERAGIVPDPSMAQIRELLTELAVLPLGSQRVHERLEPHIKALLLYGHHNTGKKLLVNAIAHSTGSTLFNLSPRNTDGKYPKKAVTMMLHIVFKVAKTMAPSVILIDEAEKVFLSDKKKLKEYASVEPYNVIKKDLAKEMKQLKPGDRVLVVGCSSEPYLCAKKDEAALINFFQKHVHMPLPDYASRQIIWPELCAKHGAPRDAEFDWPTLAQISQNYTSGQIDQVVQSMLTAPRLERLKLGTPANALQMSEFINWLALLQPAPADVDAQIRAFADKTPARAALAGGDAKPAGKKPGSKGGKKKKK